MSNTIELPLFEPPALPDNKPYRTRMRAGWAKRKPQALLQESLAVAAKTEAFKPSDLSRGDRGHDSAAQERDVPH